MCIVHNVYSTIPFFFLRITRFLSKRKIFADKEAFSLETQHIFYRVYKFPRAFSWNWTRNTGGGVEANSFPAGPSSICGQLKGHLKCMLKVLLSTYLLCTYVHVCPTSSVVAEQAVKHECNAKARRYVPVSMYMYITLFIAILIFYQKRFSTNPEAFHISIHSYNRAISLQVLP